MEYHVCIMYLLIATFIFMETLEGSKHDEENNGQPTRDKTRMSLFSLTRDNKSKENIQVRESRSSVESETHLDEEETTNEAIQSKK